MKKSIFPILAFENKNPINYEKERKDSGTGFFINEEGVFISAGHIFKNNHYFYYVLIENRIYPIKEIYREYQEQCEQDSDMYLDLFIGKIDLSDKSIPLKLSCELEIGKSLSPFGYSSLYLLCNSKEDIFIDDLHNDNNKIEEYSNNTNNLKWYDNECFSFEITSKLMKLGFNENDSTYNNGFLIDMKGVQAYGLSGCPVLTNGYVKGILIAENNCISTAYIISKLEESKIQYLLENEL